MNGAQTALNHLTCRSRDGGRLADVMTELMTRLQSQDQLPKENVGHRRHSTTFAEYSTLSAYPISQQALLLPVDSVPICISFQLRLASDNRHTAMGAVQVRATCNYTCRHRFASNDVTI